MLIPSIYVDLDDVIAETLRAFARLANEMYNKTIEFDNIQFFDLGKSFQLSPPALKDFMEAAHTRSMLLHQISANPDAREVLSEWARYGTHITIVTGRPISTYQDTLDWLKDQKIPFHALRFLRKYGRNDLVQTNKRPLDIRTVPHARFLFAVEDNPKMAYYLATKAGVPVLLPDKPWNQNAEELKPLELVTRCSDWNSIRTKALSFLNEPQKRSRA